jgi:hypothetical protein
MPINHFIFASESPNLQPEAGHETLYHTLWRIAGLLQRIAPRTKVRENA